MLNEYEKPVPVEQSRYEALKLRLVQTCGESAIFQNKAWTDQDRDLAREFLVGASRKAPPNVGPGYWEHLLLSGFYAKDLAEAAPSCGVNPIVAECAGLLHHIGSLITPTLEREALLGDNLIRRSGARAEFVDSLPPRTYIYGFQGEVELPGRMTMTQRFTYLAEVLARRLDDSLPTYGTMSNWLKNLPLRSPDNRRRFHPQAPADLLLRVVQFSIDEMDMLLNDFGISIDEISNHVQQDLETPESQGFLKQLT